LTYICQKDGVNDIKTPINEGKMTKFLVFMGVLCVLHPQLIVNLIVKNMKILKYVWIVVKFVYYLIKSIGYEPFTNAWNKAKS